MLDRLTELTVRKWRSRKSSLRLLSP